MFTKIKNSLGTPYFESESCLIYNGDTLDVLSRLSEPCINLTVTSPPYNIGKSYEKIKPLQEYINWCSEWMTKIFDITSEEGAFLLNLGYLEIPNQGKAVPIPYLLWDKSPFYMMQEIVWHYGAGVASKKSLSPRNEKFIWYLKNQGNYTFNLDAIRDPDVKYPNQKKNGKLKCNPLGKNPGDVWIYPKVTSGSKRSSIERTPHPAQFPLSVVDIIIKGMSNESDIILDPFLGSGTTCVSALKQKRKVIGIEISEEYCEIAVNRILTECKNEQLMLRI